MEAIWAIRWAIFAFVTGCYAVILYANLRQYFLYKCTKEIPAKYAELQSNDEYKKKRLNEMDLLRLSMLNWTINWLWIIPFLFFGVLPILWNSAKNLCHFFSIENEYFYSIMFTWILYTFSLISKLINAIINEIIERKQKYKNSKEAFENEDLEEKEPKCFSALKYLIKQFLIYTVFIPFGVCAFLAAVRFFGPNNLWLVAFISLNIFLFVSIFFMDYLMPYILPKRYAQLPLHECELKKNIEKICAETNVKISGIFLSKEASGLISFRGHYSKCKKVILSEIYLEVGFVKKIYEFNGKKYEEENEIDGMIEGKRRKRKAKDTVAPLLPQNGQENGEMNAVQIDENVEEPEYEYAFNDDEILGMFAAEIGLYNYKKSIRGQISHRITHLFMELLPLLICQFTYQSEMIFSAFHMPPSEQCPPIVGILLVFSIFVRPAFALYSGILSYCRIFFESHIAAKSAIQLGYGKEYRAGLVKFWTAIGIELGDWLYFIFQQGMVPIDFEELDKMLAAKTEL